MFIYVYTLKCSIFPPSKVRHSVKHENTEGLVFGISVQMGMLTKWLTSPDCPVVTDIVRSGSLSPQHCGIHPVQTDTQRVEGVEAGEGERGEEKERTRVSQKCSHLINTSGIH